MDASFVFFCVERFQSNHLRWETRKKHHVISSRTPLSPVLLNRFFRLVLWSFPSGWPYYQIPVCIFLLYSVQIPDFKSNSCCIIKFGSYYQIPVPSSSIAKEMSGYIEWWWRPLDVVTFADDALFGNLSQHAICHSLWLCGWLVLFP